MSDHLFNSAQIWGTPTQAVGPTRPYRAQMEKLPGVDGARVYQLGKDPAVWRVSGRLTASSLAALKAAVWSNVNYENGQVYTFTDSDGAVYTNCILQGYRMAGRPEGILTGGVTVKVEATVIWLSPNK